jgi:hypothetical protein
VAGMKDKQKLMAVENEGRKQARRVQLMEKI